MSRQTVTLGQVSELLIGFAFKSAGFLDADTEGIKLVRGDNVQQGVIRWGNKTKKWPNEDFADLARYQLRAGDVILAMDRPIVGGGLKLAWITENDLPSLLVQRVCCMRGKAGVADTLYLRYVLSHPGFSGHIERITTGANIPHISGKDIAAYSFLLPSLNEQQRIAEAIAAYDDLIENNQRRIKLLEEAARRLNREWFVALRFPGHERVKVVDGVPQGWDRIALAEAIEINPRTRANDDEVHPFVPMQALSESSMVITDYEMRIPTGAKFRNGDTLLARITPCLENGKTGFVQFLPDNESMASGSTEFIVMRSPKSGSPYWVYCLARDESFRDHAIRSMVGSDGRQRVNTKLFDQYLVLKPPQPMFEKFDHAVQSIFRQVHSLSMQDKSLKQARDALLPRLMSGALAV